MRRPYCILNVLGDVLDDGELRFVGATKTLKAARRCVKVLGESGPGTFVIYNQQIGERLFIEVGGERAVAKLAGSRLRFFQALHSKRLRT